MDAFESRRNPSSVPVKAPFPVNNNNNNSNNHNFNSTVPWGGEDAHRVLVVIDVGKELSYTALDWTLDHVLHSGDHLKLLGVWPQISNPNKAGFQAGLSKLGYKSWIDEKGWNGVNCTVLDSELLSKKQLLQSSVDLVLRCRERGISLDVDVQVARDLKSLVVEVAKHFGAHHVVLDRSMKKDKKHYTDNLTCPVTRVKTNDTCPHIRPGLLPPPAPTDVTSLQPRSPAAAAATPSSPQILAAAATLDRRPSHRRSSAAVFRSADTDHPVHGFHDEAEEGRLRLPESVEGEEESEPGILTAAGRMNSNTRRQELVDVRQWLEDQGSPEPGLYRREESLQLSASPRSDIASPPAATEVDGSSCAFPSRKGGDPPGVGTRTPGSTTTTTITSPPPLPPSLPSQQEITVANSSVSPVSEDSPTTAASLTTQAEPPAYGAAAVKPLPNHPAHHHSNNNSNSTSSSSPLVSRTSALGLSDHAWGSMPDTEAINPRNDKTSSSSHSRTHPGPISVQPRRVDAKWTLQNLNGLLNGDHGSGFSSSGPKGKSSKAMMVSAAAVAAKLSASKSTPTLPSAAAAQSSPALTVVHQQPPSPQQEGGGPVDHRGSQRLSSSQSQRVGPSFFLKRKPGPLAPPLCTVCQHKTPEFGKAVRRFSYAELLYATDRFHHHNYLAPGGYGSVYRGILPEGQLIAVKQHKLASSQGDDEFCAEVEVLSCAQHRNLVTLIGYCVEYGKRLLVYEYVCNGSLDRHLSAKNREAVLPWKYRQKIALGSARALRYLHEECRVGCIVHRDMRPNNILLTHDFTPMVGDFGLARRQMHGDMAEETRVLGTRGYLAPEYAETGQITEKADVFAFGVVLLEIITGRKAVLSNAQGGKSGVLLTDWARELLDRPNLELVDSRLRGTECSDNNLFEMHCMMHAARQCIKKDPAMRPRMAQVLRILDPQQDGESLYGLGGMAGRKMTPPENQHLHQHQLPAYYAGLQAAAAAPDSTDSAAAAATGKQETATTAAAMASSFSSSPSSLPDDTTSSSHSHSHVTSSSPSLSSSHHKPSKHKGMMKGKSKSMFKTSRSSSAPRLSYDEQRNLEDEEEGFREGVLLSYNSMLEFV